MLADDLRNPAIRMTAATAPDTREKRTAIWFGCRLRHVFPGHLYPLGPGPSDKSLRHSGGNLAVQPLGCQLGERLSADLGKVVGRAAAAGTAFEVRS